MLFTDILNDVRVDALVKTDQRISAQNVHVVHFDQPVAELFVLNCISCVTPLPQNMCTFPEKGNARVAGLCSLARSLNEVADLACEGLPGDVGKVAKPPVRRFSGGKAVRNRHGYLASSGTRANAPHGERALTGGGALSLNEHFYIMSVGCSENH